MRLLRNWSLCCSIVILGVLLSGPVRGARIPRPQVAFEQNVGQAASEVRYLARTAGGTVLLTKNGAMLRLGAKSGGAAATIAMHFSGSATDAAISGSDLLPGKVNYFRGQQKNWRTNIATYGQVRYRGLYAGVDAVFHSGPAVVDGVKADVEFDLIAAPRAKVEAVRMDFSGDQPTSIHLTKDEGLSADAGGNRVVLRKPMAWQEDAAGRRQAVEVAFAVRADHSVGFRVGTYDQNRQLTIDPAIAYSTFIGGSGDEGVFAIKRDVAENIYLVGETTSVDFPIAGPVQGQVGGDYDAFVMKLDPSGTKVVYSTFLGGSKYENANGLVLDKAGNVYFTGETRSPDFPVVNALIGSQPGGIDGFVAGLDASGSSLLFSTYLGGTGTDIPSAIAIDRSGGIYIAGSTSSSNFPVTAGAFQPACSKSRGMPVCSTDGFVTKMNSTGTHFIYSTYLGGASYDYIGGMTVDTTGRAYVAGTTSSADFPTVAAYAGRLGGGSDAFVTELDENGSGLVFSTFYGGSGTESANDIARDAFGNLYVVGSTTSNDLPLANPFQAGIGGSTDVFVAKFNPAADRLIYASYLGGSQFDFFPRVAVDTFGSAAITGGTNSPDFPVLNAVQTMYGGGVLDLFVTKISPDGGHVLYSTYLGGSGDDHPDGMYSDLLGRVWVGGSTGSPEFRVTSDALQASYAGGPYDGYLTRIDMDDASILETFRESLDAQDYGQLLRSEVRGVLRRLLDGAAESGTHADLEVAASEYDKLLRRRE